MKRMTVLWMAPLTLGLALSPLVARMEESGGDRKPDRQAMEARHEKMMEQLNLTPEQREKLKAHRQTHRQEAEALRKAMKEKRDAIRTEMEKPDFNVDRMKALHKEMNVIQNQLSDHRLDGILEVRKILTPEQFKTFQELTRKRMEERRGDWGKQDKRRGRPIDDDDGMR